MKLPIRGTTLRVLLRFVEMVFALVVVSTVGGSARWKYMGTGYCIFNKDRAEFGDHWGVCTWSLIVGTVGLCLSMILCTMPIFNKDPLFNGIDVFSTFIWCLAWLSSAITMSITLPKSISDCRAYGDGGINMKAGRCASAQTALAFTWLSFVVWVLSFALAVKQRREVSSGTLAQPSKASMRRTVHSEMPTITPTHTYTIDNDAHSVDMVIGSSGSMSKDATKQRASVITAAGYFDESSSAALNRTLSSTASSGATDKNGLAGSDGRNVEMAPIPSEVHL